MAFTPKAMDDKIRPSDIYITKPSPNFLDDDSNDSNNVVNEDQWGGRWNCYITIEYKNKKRC
jgi:hypothetical protein